MLPALAFVPQEDIIESFETLIKAYDLFTNKELLTPLIDYFESNWIGRLQRRHRWEPKFSIPIWNCFSLEEADLPQTNNSVGGWHNCFLSMSNYRFIHLYGNLFLHYKKKNLPIYCPLSTSMDPLYHEIIIHNITINIVAVILS